VGLGGSFSARAGPYLIHRFIFKALLRGYRVGQIFTNIAGQGPNFEVWGGQPAKISCAGPAAGQDLLKGSGQAGCRLGPKLWGRLNDTVAGHVQEQLLDPHRALTSIFHPQIHI